MPQPNTSRRKLSPRDYLRLAHSRESAQRFEHEHGLHQHFNDEQQREAQAQQREAHTRQRIADGQQAQATVEAQIWTLAHRLADLNGEVVRDANDAVDAHDALEQQLQTLRAQLLTTVQELVKQQCFADALSQQQLTTEQDGQRLQQQLLDALTQLLRPKKVTIQRDKNRKIIGAEVG